MLPARPRRTATDRLYFEAPGVVAIRREPLPAPGVAEVVVRTLVSAISAGTELLFYRGEVPAGIALDATLPALAGAARYPLRYGYACVGVVEQCGPGVAPAWLGKRVFAFEPHASAFCARTDDLHVVPDGLPTDAAALLPNAETAVNLLLDGAPLLGERVAVFGAGMVGLLTTQLLATFPLARLSVVEPNARRRAHALRLGAHAAYATPGDGGDDLLGCDLVFELSGNPAALNAALAAAGFDARVVVGSWYGVKQAALDLGGHFHRSRIRLIGSQVSTIAPALAGRWHKQRRIEQAWRLLARVDAPALTTNRLPFVEAPYAYQLIDQQPGDVLQMLLTYGEALSGGVG